MVVAATVALGAIPFVLTACSREESVLTSSVFVDGFLEEWGVVSAAEGAWADAFHDGWRLEGERAFALVPQAGLRLEITDPEDYALSVVAAAPPEVDPLVVQVRLNDEVLGEMTLGPEQATCTFSTRAEQWNEGTNLLGFSLRNVESSSQGLHWALSQVTYAPEPASPRVRESASPRVREG